MPIVSSAIVRNHNRGNGSLSVHEQHADHTGHVHEHRYYCPVDHDVNQALIDWVPVLESSLVANEKEVIQTQAESGDDPALIDTKHITVKQKNKRIIKALMIGNPAKMLRAAQYVQSYTNAQIEQIFTVSQRMRIRARQNYIIDNQSTFIGDLREEL